VKYCFIFFAAFCCSANAQNRFLDYFVDQKNDTIYGTIRNGVLFSEMYIKNPNPDIDGIAFYVKNIENAAVIRYNDKLFYPIPKSKSADAIYDEREIIDTTIVIIRARDFQNVSPKLPDYIVTNASDTLFGIIRRPILAKMYLERRAKKFKIDIKTVAAYRYENKIFRRTENAIPSIFGSKTTFLELLQTGQTNLYAYREDSDGNADAVGSTYLKSLIFTAYFVEKNGEIIPIPRFPNSEKLNELFGDKQQIIEKIKDKTYTMESIYLIVKYYNEL
jgi:hypothetical protein